MVSRNPDELEEELRDMDVVVDEETLELVLEEASDTVDAQVTLLSDIDSKASKLIRLNFIFLGILVSVVSVLSQNGSGETVASAIQPYVNVYMKTGVTALVFSTVAAAVTFSVSDIDVGVEGESLQEFIDTPVSTEDSKAYLIMSHIMRINWNRSENIRNVPLIQASILLVVASMTLFALGIYQIANGGVPWYLSLSVVLGYLGFVWAVDFRKQVSDAVEDVREWRT